MAKHTTLASLFSDIAVAIRAKTGKTDKLVADDFPTAIAGITTGVNTSDATVTAEDMAKDVIAYGADGKVTGTATTVAGGLIVVADNSMLAAGYLMLREVFTWPTLFRKNAAITVRLPATSLGTAEPSDVRKGKTFTSSAGMNITGTWEGD